MSSSSVSPYVVHWGIIGCGWISSEFVQGLSLIRDEVTDVYHSVTAVGSRDVKKAQDFIKEYTPKGGNAQQLGHDSNPPEACGSYDEVYDHPRVTAIYIGTPNTSHYTDCLSALRANKNVLLEKPATLNRREWEELREEAGKRGLFLMEAVWTRFLPLAYDLQDHLFNKKTIGDVKVVDANFSLAMLDNVPDTHRTLSPLYAGGPLYDIGPYTFLLALLCLYHDPRNELTPPSKVVGTMMMCRTGCDLSTSVMMMFEKTGAVANLFTSFAIDNPRDRVATISGTKGEIIIAGPALSRLCKMTIRQHDGDNHGGNKTQDSKFKEDVVVEMDFPGFGLHFEADAVARSLKAGEFENARMPHSETSMVMQMFDDIRAANGYKFPSEK